MGLTCSLSDPPPLQCTHTLIHAGARTHARTLALPHRSKEEGAQWPLLAELRGSSYCLGGVRREMLSVGSCAPRRALSVPSSFSLDALRSLCLPYDPSTPPPPPPPPCSCIDSAGFSQSPGFAVKSWRKRRSAAEPKHRF